MTTAILDSNVLVQSIIGSPRSASARVREAYYDGKFEAIFSPATFGELIDVLTLPTIRNRHGLSDDELEQFLESLLPGAVTYPGNLRVAADIARDLTDTKFLALAEESVANYLVTNDRRHLLRLGHFGSTRIVTPNKFLTLLP